MARWKERMMETELLPCPFCGGRNLQFRKTNLHFKPFYKCLDCWADGPVAADKKSLPEKWNTRTAPAPLPQDGEEL
jgi:Lar family restriction alleviation protein